ncbi:hypothetical protein BCR33DRAFT_711553 [Rhizoclosmatium globosum]|uniref:protein disulfide-isomerase n=1 Tax=Rhizoclosmatium globosum TaxID=329046 RepID=A0A1Y2D1Q4_9FUNG|nr:hypothetical protein BCR33DRAFT_711553 [Rhizoclosmatium globosum]|eukprot:ORY53218.1 hypothetical protein BCR33DRAFT_711553 [Rhizoclosmatium globosum]
MAFKLSEKGFEFGSVDCSVPKAKEICQEAKVTKFPTLKIYRDGKMSKYLHERTVETMSKYLMRQVKGAFREIENTPKHIAAFKKSEDFAVLGSFTDKDSSAFKAYKQAAKNISIDYTFGYTFGNTTIRSPLIATPLNKFTKDAIIDFVKTAALPLIGDLDEKNFPLYQAMKLPIGFTYIHDKMTAKPCSNCSHPWPKSTAASSTSFSLTEPNLTKMMILPPRRRRRRLLPTLSSTNSNQSLYLPLNADFLAKFLNKFVKGEMKPVVESDPVPETNNGLVKVVVAESDYQERFERTLNRIAELIKSHTKKIVVAVMNMKTNRLPKTLLMLVKSVERDTRGAADFDISKTEFTLPNVMEFLENNSNFSAELKDWDVKQDEKMT